MADIKNLPGVAVNQEKPKLNMTLGSTGLKQYSGFIDEEFLPRLRGMNGINLYNEMKNNSPAIAASLGLIELLIREVDWFIEPADESDAAKAEAEDTEFALFEDMQHTFEDFISEALSMLAFGYSPFEITYKQRRGPAAKDPKFRSNKDDGKWGWRKIEIRAQETVDRWAIDEDGEIAGFVQLDTYAPGSGPVFIPEEKMLLFRTKTFKNNPEGYSLLRPAVIPYWYIKRIQEIEAIGIERNLAGMPIMEVPAEVLAPDAGADFVSIRTSMEQFITQVKMDERWGGLVPSELKEDGSPSGYKFKLMQSSGRKLVDTDVVIRRYETRIFQLFLTQFLVMGTEKVGSFSLSSNMTNLFATSIGAIMDNMASIMNRFLIPRRQRLNGVDTKLDPFIKHGDIEGQDLEKLSKYVESLAKVGLLQPNEALERELLQQANLPEPPEETFAEPAADEISSDVQEAINVVTQPQSGGAESGAEPVVLNGAQVTALVTLLQQVSIGALPADSVRAIISAAFPIDDQTIERMLQPILAQGIQQLSQEELIVQEE